MEKSQEKTKNRLDLTVFEEIFKSDNEWQEKIERQLSPGKEIEQPSTLSMETQADSQENNRLKSELDVLMGDLIELKKIIDEDNVTYVYRNEGNERSNIKTQNEDIPVSSDKEIQKDKTADPKTESSEDKNIGLMEEAEPEMDIDLINQTNFFADEMEDDEDSALDIASNRMEDTVGSENNSEETDFFNLDESKDLNDQADILDSAFRNLKKTGALVEGRMTNFFETDIPEAALARELNDAKQAEDSQNMKISQPSLDKESARKSALNYAKWEKTTEYILDESGKEAGVYRENIPE